VSAATTVACRVLATAALTLATFTPAHAQWWENVPKGSAPRDAKGEIDLTAPAPRRPDGKPDLSGIWEPNGNRFLRDIAVDLKPGDVPFQPWAKKVADERADGSHSREDPDANCLPQGVPRLAAAPAPWKIVQTDDLIVIVHEAFSLWRQIFMDGRKLGDTFNPTWLGYSSGHWEGNTLVVDTRGFNGRAWLDQVGKPTTDKLHVIERYTRKDYGHMDLEITIDDPGAYTKPWTVKQDVHLLNGTELLEFICNENNKDVGHLSGGSVK